MVGAALCLLLLLQGLFVYVFSIPVPNFIKKIPHPTFLLCAKNVDLVTGVGQLGGFLLCSSVG